MIKDKKPYRVFIIEDNPGDLFIVEDLLIEQMLDPVITLAHSFKQASEILSAKDTACDVILLDLSLPDKSGQSLINDMLRIAPACPIIILTGYADIEFSIKSISQGIIDYLVKDELTSGALYKSIIYSIERKSNISKIKDSEKRYSDLFNLSPQPMWLFDPESFRFLQVNKAAIALYGYTEEEFLNMTLLDIKVEGDMEKIQQSEKNVVSGNPLFNETVIHHKKSGEKIQVEIYSRIIVINNKELRSVIAIDVTEKNLFEHKIIKAIIKTQEDERYEIGSELHDNVCQILATSQLSLGMLKKSVSPENMKWYERCREFILLAADEVRNLSHRLAPAFFDDSTLEEAFNILLETFNIAGNYEIMLNVDESVTKATLSIELQLNLYRILQEQLKNILKYAKADIIHVEVIIHDHRLRMKISDDGVGFNVDEAKRGIGLANMKRRAELFSGKFEITSSPGNGCIVTVTIPLTEAG